MALKNELLLLMMARLDTSSEGTFHADVVVVWHALLGKFSPLIGPASVSILFLRSMDANRAAFPWLPPSHQGTVETPFSAFEATLEAQPRDQAIRATRAMLGTYIDSLFTLIGITLTSQFVCSAFRRDGDQKN